MGKDNFIYCCISVIIYAVLKYKIIHDKTHNLDKEKTNNTYTFSFLYKNFYFFRKFTDKHSYNVNQLTFKLLKLIYDQIQFVTVCSPYV